LTPIKHSYLIVRWLHGFTEDNEAMYYNDGCAVIQYSRFLTSFATANNHQLHVLLCTNLFFEKALLIPSWNRRKHQFIPNLFLFEDYDLIFSMFQPRSRLNF
jgi:hypothetical protein